MYYYLNMSETAAYGMKEREAVLRKAVAYARYFDVEDVQEVLHDRLEEIRTGQCTLMQAAAPSAFEENWQSAEHDLVAELEEMDATDWLEDHRDEIRHFFWLLCVMDSEGLEEHNESLLLKMEYFHPAAAVHAMPGLNFHAGVAVPITLNDAESDLVLECAREQGAQVDEHRPFTVSLQKTSEDPQTNRNVLLRCDYTDAGTGTAASCAIPFAELQQFAAQESRYAVYEELRDWVGLTFGA